MRQRLPINVNVRFTESDFRRLEELAARQDTSLSRLVRRAVREHLSAAPPEEARELVTA